MQSSNLTNPIVFHGTTGQFFKIWIVNVLLTICTLGIFLPWAFVRSRKYFYSNTEINGYRFDYHAKPTDILLFMLAFLGCLVLMLPISLVLSSLYLPLGFTPIIAFYLAIPAILIFIFSYNLRMTSFNHLRFNFNGGYLKGYLVLFIYPILVITAVSLISELLIPTYHYGDPLFLMFLYTIFNLVLFFIGMAIVSLIGYSYLINNSLFDNTSFKAELNFWPFLKITFIGLLIILPFIAVALYMVIDIFSIIEGMYIYQRMHGLDGSLMIHQYIQTQLPRLYIAYGWILFGAILAGCYQMSALFNYLFSQTKLAHLRFQSSLSSFYLMWLVISNAVMIVFTLGLMTPYAEIRSARYFAQSIQVIGELNFDEETKEAEEAIAE